MTSHNLSQPTPSASAADSEMTSLNPRRWAMFAVLLVGAFLPPLDFFIVNVALPSIQQDLGASSSAEQLVISSYAALYAVTLITGGRLGDLFGRERMFIVGLIGFASASVLCGLAWSPWALVSGRALQGLTAAVMAPQALASVQAIFSEKEKHLALSLFGAVFGLASVVGQALGGILISLDVFGLGWRAIFLVNLPVALLVIVFAIPLLRETRARDPRKLDLIGTALSVMTLTALIVPLIEGREAGWPSWAWLSLATVPLLAATFWRYQGKLAQAGGSPLLDPRALRAPGLARGLTVALLFYTISTFFLLFSVYLQQAVHMSALDAGLVFLPFGLGYLLGPLISPASRLVFGPFVTPFGMTIEAIGLYCIAWLIAATSPGTLPDQIWLILFLFLTGFGQGLATPGLMHMVIGRVSPTFSGMIAGVTSSALQVSVALSVAVIGGVFYSLSGEDADAGQLAHAFAVALIVIATSQIVGAGLGLTIARQPVSNPTQHPHANDRR
ncbi:Predicted arabinose efflux permease, MFS family [Rhizobium sp. NFR07]|uniref:MFS transporter n=1 Tax=Rhizobium sp. NFR07 TaxID=1566262 RepID=UPI0008EB921B|nr:MFS transporter [Rhizobium sp. NFR07]SFB65112.1 Predicted arabinose efflux permease, MFS family [Rhizobium sp. NFR07]